MPPQSGDAASSAPGGAFLRPPSPPETHGLDLNACDEQHMQGRAGPGPAQGSSSAHADGGMHAGKDAMLEAARMAHPLAPGGPGIVFTPASTHPHSRGGHSFLMLSTSQQSIPMALFPMATTDTGMSSAQLSNQTNTTLNLNHSGPYAVQLLSSDSSAAITHAAMHMPKPQALSNSNMGTAASAWSSSDGALTPSVAASLGTSSAPSATAIRAALGPQDTIPAPTSTQVRSRCICSCSPCVTAGSAPVTMHHMPGAAWNAPASRGHRPGNVFMFVTCDHWTPSRQYLWTVDIGWFCRLCRTTIRFLHVLPADVQHLCEPSRQPHQPHRQQCKHAGPEQPKLSIKPHLPRVATHWPEHQHLG